jgi:hypothetical protein
MAHVLIVHEVADYLAWKAVFESAAGIRRDAGEREFQVLKYARALFGEVGTGSPPK